MNLFKKTTATIALTALVSGIFSTGVSASSSTEVAAANALATAGYINDQSSDTAAYNLNQNVLRQEIAAVARGISGEAKKTTCDNSFTDVSATTPNTWACFSIEALLDADLIAPNTMFKPENEISKAEAIGMMVKATFGGDYAYDSSKGTSWQAQVVEFAVSQGVVSNFTNYDTAATRGFVFEAANNAMVASEEVVETCDEVSQLLGLCGDDSMDNTTTDDTVVISGDTTTDDTVVISGDNVLTVELSATTPAGTDLPKSAKGVEVLSFDVTAGSEDVSITAMEVERTGFGEGAAEQVAVYTEEGRASKVKSFSSSDDIANLTFSPAVVIKAGETRTLTAKVNTDINNIGEFAISVTNITASSTVDAATIVSNYFDVKAVTAATLTILDEGVNVSVKAGEQQADLAEFKLTNDSSLSTDVDITISSITLKEIGTASQEEVLENITLNVNGEVIATVASMTDKYLTFNFDPFVIEDDKNETFTIKADIMGGAGDNVQFKLDNDIDITAVASKYNAINLLGSFAPATAVSIDAGELTIYAIEATSDEIRSDKSNVVFGQLKVVNVAGKNLELQNLGLLFTSTNSGVLQLVENVEFEVNGTSYELTSSTASTSATGVTYSDTDLNIIIPQGTTILTVRADTLTNLIDNETIKISLSNAASGGSDLRVEETADDVAVTDISPSALTWNKVTVVNSAATLANVPLANIEVVKGASDLVALQFEIEAGKASYVSTDRIKVKLTENTSTGTAITKNSVSQISLFKGSVSESNLLDRVSGSKLDANGVVTFDGFDVEIAADATETFLVTITTVDTTSVVNKIIIASVANTNIDLVDDENDNVTLNTLTVFDREITVKDSGVLVLTSDSNNVDNQDSKTILAGEEVVVYSTDTKATNEEVNVETVVFTLNKDLKTVIKSAKLYLNDIVVATASNSKVSQAANSVITFDNISNLDFPTDTAELKLAIITENICYEKIGSAIAGVTVTNVSMADAEGVDSAEIVTITDLTVTGSNTFDIVPTTVVASASNIFVGTNNLAQLTFAVNSGNNTTSSGNTLTATLSGVTIEVSSILTNGTGTITLTNSTNDIVGSGSVNVNGVITLSIIANEVISNGEVYTLETTAEATFKLTKNGVEYSADGAIYNMNLKANENLGSYNDGTN